MSRDLSRLLQPASIAVAGGSWAANVIRQLQKAGYDGDIWPLHPTREELLGLPCVAAVEDLPGAPDAVFIGVNRELTIDLVGRLVQLETPATSEGMTYATRWV